MTLLSSYPTRAEAFKAARYIRSLLKRPQGWKPHVHCSEPNPKHRKHAVWYVNLVNGPMTLMYSVYTSGNPRFWTLMDNKVKGWPGCGDPRWTTTKSFRNPNTAIVAQVRAAQPVFAQMRKVEAYVTPFLDYVK